MDFSDAFRFVNLAVGILIILGGVGQFWPSITVQGVIIAVYCWVFGLATAALEFQIPPQIARYGSFMFSFIGRGVFYIFFGCIQMGDNWWKYLSGALVVFAGIAYVVLEFTPSIEPPANMRDADAGWGAEQV